MSTSHAPTVMSKLLHNGRVCLLNLAIGRVEGDLQLPTLQPNYEDDEIMKGNKCKVKTSKGKVRCNFMDQTYLVAESGQAYKRNQNKKELQSYTVYACMLCKLSVMQTTLHTVIQYIMKRL